MTAKKKASFESFKEVWYQKKLWKVEKVLRPTKMDTYLLLSRLVMDSIHTDRTTPVDMAVVSVSNDEFYPNIAEVSKSMAELEKGLKRIVEIETTLTDIWFKTVTNCK